MKKQTESISNLDSIKQHFDKMDSITKSLKLYEIPPLIFGVGNWTMDWTSIRFGKFRGKSLPEIIFVDADYFFYAFENNFFYGDLAKQAEELYRRARSIWVPSRNGQKMLVQYFFDYNPKSKKEEFSMMKLISDGSDLGLPNVSPWIDFFVPRSRSHFDKNGYKNFVVALKGILFGNPSYRMNTQSCELFFNRQRYFDLRRVKMMQL